MGLLSREEIEQLGFASVGSDVMISDRCSIYGAAAISIGDHVRIDDYAVLTARDPLTIGSYVHISAFAFLSGTFGITIEDFVNVAAHATLLSANDDFSGPWMIGSQVPATMRNVHGARVRLQRHSAVGAASVVLPGVDLGQGAAVGALSLVKESLAPWQVYAGVPARRICSRDRSAEVLAAGLSREAGSTAMPTP